MIFSINKNNTRLMFTSLNNIYIVLFRLAVVIIVIIGFTDILST